MWLCGQLLLGFVHHVLTPDFLFCTSYAGVSRIMQREKKKVLTSFAEGLDHLCFLRYVNLRDVVA